MFLSTNRMTMKSDLGDETPSMAEKGETLQPLLSGFFVALVFMLGTQRQKKLKVAYESVFADWPCSVSCLSQVRSPSSLSHVCLRFGPLLVCLRLGLQSVFVSSTLVYLGCASTPVLCQTFVHVPLTAVYPAVGVGVRLCPNKKMYWWCGRPLWSLQPWNSTFAWMFSTIIIHVTESGLLPMVRLHDSSMWPIVLNQQCSPRENTVDLQRIHPKLIIKACITEWVMIELCWTWKSFFPDYIEECDVQRMCMCVCVSLL